MRPAILAASVCGRVPFFGTGGRRLYSQKAWQNSSVRNQAVTNHDKRQSVKWDIAAQGTNLEQEKSAMEHCWLRGASQQGVCMLNRGPDVLLQQVTTSLLSQRAISYRVCRMSTPMRCTSTPIRRTTTEIHC